jgi:translocation and assembly module TamB
MPASGRPSSIEMRIVKRILRLLRLALLLLLALAVGAVLVFTLTQTGRDNLASLISRMASTEDAKVRIGGIDGIWSGALTLDHVVLEDREGAWLVARGVAVDWSPLALLGSTFRAERVHADRVEFARLPQPSKQESGGEGGGLPVAIDIEAIDLPRIALGGAIAGGIAQVSAKGSLHAEADPVKVATDLTVKRTDGQAGDLAATIRFAPADNQLELDVRGSEAAGGILANLLKLPGAPPVEVNVTGKGPIADWKGDARLAVDGAVVTRLSATHRVVDGARQITAKGTGEFERFLPASLAPLLAGSADIDAAAVLGADGSIGIDHADIRSAAISASARGSIDPKGASDFVLQADATNGAVELTFGSGDDPASLLFKSATVRAFGAGDAPTIDASVSLDRVAAAGIDLRGLEARLHSDGFDIAGRSGPLTVEANAASGSSTIAALAPLIDGAVALTAKVSVTPDTVTVQSGTLKTHAVGIGVAGEVGLAGSVVAIGVKGEVVTSALPEAARKGLGERLAFAGKLGRDAGGKLSVDGLELASGGATAQGDASFDEGLIDVDIEGSLADIGPFVEGATGQVAFSLGAKGNVLKPDFSASLSSSELAVAGQTISDLEATVSGIADIANPAADLSVKGRFANQPLAITGKLADANGRRQVSDLSASLGSNTITGNLVLDQDFIPEGTLKLALADVGQLAAIAGQVASGVVEGTIELGRKDGAPRAIVKTTSQSLDREDVTASNVAIDATVSDYLVAPAMSGRIRVGQVDAGGATIADVDVQLARDGVWTGFAAGATANGIPVKADGRVKIEGGVTTLELTSANATVKGIAAALAEPSTITVENGAVALDGLALDVAGGTVVVSGAAGKAIDLTADIKGVPASVAHSFYDGIGAEGSLSGVARVRLDAASAEGTAPLDVRLSLDHIAVAPADISGIDARIRSDAFNLSSLSGTLRAEVTADALQMDNETLAPLLAGPVTISAEAAITDAAIDIRSGSLKTDAITANLSGRIARPANAISMAVAADIAAAALPVAARPVLDDRVAVSGKVTRDADGAISVDGLKLASGDLSAPGSASLAEGVVKAAIEGALADVGRLAQGATGAIGFKVDAEGRQDAPNLSLNVTSDSIEAAGRTISDLALQARGTFDMANPAATVSLTGDVAGSALKGSAELKTVEGRRQIHGLSVTLGDNRITGDLDLDDRFVPQGSIALVIPDVGPLAALAFETAKGDITGTIEFTRDGGKARVAVDARTNSLQRGDLVASNVEVDATVADYLGTPSVSGRVDAAEVTSGSTRIGKVGVSLGRDGNWTTFSGGATVNDIPARAEGRVKLEGGVATIELAKGDATVSGIGARIARPTTVVVKDGEATLDKFALDVAGGSVTVSGTAGEKLALDVAIAALPATVANSFSPGLDAAGTISGTARIAGAAARPEVDYAIDWRNAQTAQTRSAGLGAMSISSRGAFSAGTLKFQADIGGASGLGLKGGGTVGTSGARTLDLDFSGKVPFSFLTARLAAQGLSLTGGADVSVQVRGPAAGPAIGGSIRTSGARFVDSRSGIAINDISANVSLGGGQATINSLKGTLSTGGAVTASGTVGIAAASGFPADLTVKIVNGRYTDGRVVTTTLNGDLALKGSLVAAPLLSGKISLGRTVITVPEKLPASLSTLDVRHKNAPGDVIAQQEAIRPAQAEGSGGGGGINLDLAIDAPQQIFIQGRGLDAELGGSIRLVGSSASPQATGQFTLRRGRLSILGKRLTFTEGTLSFAGSLIPYLDLTAESSATDATVTVLVSGLATNPKFTFSSIPMLPEDEVLARLIFGRSMSNLSPLQIAQLASAAAQLAGVGGSTSLLENLRNQVGIDDLDVRTDAEGNASVSAGKYLNDRTYVTIEKGEKAGSGKATINLDVGRGVKLRGEAGESGEAKGGIFFEREY